MLLPAGFHWQKRNIEQRFHSLKSVLMSGALFLYVPLFRLSSLLLLNIRSVNSQNNCCGVEYQKGYGIEPVIQRAA
jgi:hypothetical protein